MSTGLIFALLCAVAAIVYGVVSIGWIMKKPSGNERMLEIAAAIQAGAKAYLNRQYRTIAMVGVVVFVILLVALGLEKSWTYGWHAAVGFLIGAGLSAAAGYIGMMVSVRVNIRTAEAARKGLGPALKVAFRGGSVTDFVKLPLGWPPFNIADASITLGILALVIVADRTRERDPKPAEGEG